MKNTLLRTPLLLSLMFLPLSLHAKIISNTQYGFTMENEVVLSQSVDIAWQHFIQDIDHWWPKDHTWWGEKSTLTIDDYAGGCFCERTNSAMGNSAEHMRVSFVDKHKLLRMTGGLGPLQGMGIYGALDWKFEPQENGGTRIVMRYQANGYNPENYEQFIPIVDKVQAIQIRSFANYMQAKQ